jgi:hypothetical protein
MLDAMDESHTSPYQAARRTALWTRRLGVVIVLVCAFFFFSAVAQLMAKRSDVFGVDISVNPLVMAASLFLGMCGFILIAFSAAIPPLADLAELTKKLTENSRRLIPAAPVAVIPELTDLAESNKRLAENLRRLIPAAQAPDTSYRKPLAVQEGVLDDEVLFNAILRGIPWSRYADGRVEADLPGGKRIFKNFDEFESYVDATGGI